MFYKIKNINTLPNYKLIVQFENGITKTYDVSNLFEKNKIFISLKDNHLLFESATVDKDGYGVIWNDEIDISCNELWNNGIDKTDNT